MTRLVEARARTAGALTFSDPGMQAAISSVAHMRGEGGAQAILNSMAGAPITRSGRLSPETIAHIRTLTPAQFQAELRAARVAYDRQVYGGTTTSQGGQRQNWWTRYGAGLEARYRREETEFGRLSPND